MSVYPISELGGKVDCLFKGSMPEGCKQEGQTEGARIPGSQGPTAIAPARYSTASPRWRWDATGLRNHTIPDQLCDLSQPVFTSVHGEIVRAARLRINHRTYLEDRRSISHISPLDHLPTRESRFPGRRLSACLGSFRSCLLFCSGFLFFCGSRGTARLPKPGCI